MNTSGIAATAYLVILFSINGCAQSSVFSPPPNGEQVTVTVKVPKDLAADTMRVMYRSAKCPSRESADGVAYEVDGFYPIEVQPRQVGQSDLYEAKLARDGGGACQWKLSNVTFGVSYRNTKLFGESATPGGGGGVIVAFDENLTQRRSMYPPIEISGDVLIKEDYFPWVDRQFRGNYKTQVWLAGKGEIYLSYRALQAKSIRFEPILHERFTVYSVWPKEHSAGKYIEFTYPDGSVVADGSSEPDFEKLQSIKNNLKH